MTGYKIARPMAVALFGLGLLLAAGCHRQAKEPDGEPTALTDESELADRQPDPVPRRVENLDAETVEAASRAIRTNTVSIGRGSSYGWIDKADLQERIDDAEDGSVVHVGPGEYTGSLLIEDRQNLTIKAEPGTAWVVSESETADVLMIEDSESITVEGLGFLHRTQGHCGGGVVQIRNSTDIAIRNCDLSGSGVTGVSARNTTQLVVERNHIHHCTHNTVHLKRVFGASIRDNLFRKNEERAAIPEGIVLRAVYGPVTIASNTFVDNPSTPITVRTVSPTRGEALSKPDIVVRNNVFRHSQSAREGKRASIWKSDNVKQGWDGRVERLEVADNCFDDSGGRGTLGDHVGASTAVRDNYVGSMELDDRHRVSKPATCRRRGAATIGWLDEARDPK